MSLPTDPPTWVEGLPGVGRTPVLVTGGTGTLGSAVVEELVRSQVPAVVLSREHHPSTEATTYVQGDLTTGAGLAEAVTDVQAVVHCATNPTDPTAVDVDGTARLLETLGEVNPQAHLVLVSIVGALANPLPYYRAKVRTESLVTAWPGPSTIVRATQLHQLVESLARLGVGPVGLGLRGLRFAPVDPVFVAGRLVDHALSEPQLEPVEIAGPETLTAREVSILTARVDGRRPPRVLPLPPVGAVMQAFARGSNLPGPSAERGGRTYAEWLAEKA